MGFVELLEWLWDDVLKYLVQRYRKIFNASSWAGLGAQILFYLIDNLPLAIAVAAFFHVAVPGLTAAFVTVGSALTTAGIAVGGLLTGIPIVGPLLGMLPSVMPAVLGFLGLGALGPVGWGLAAVLALPAIVGGFTEAFARIANCFNTKEPVWIKVIRAAFAFVALPLNFVYGFCRTAWHLVTGRGYLGSVKETFDSVRVDLARENAMADSGGGSLLRGAVPTIVDKLIVAPVIGALSGLVAGYKEGWKLGGLGKLFTIIPVIPALHTLRGVYRSFLKGGGSAAARDTYLSADDEIPTPRTTVPPLPEYRSSADPEAYMSSYVDVARGLGVRMGMASSVRTKDSNRYEVARDIGRLAAHSKAISIDGQEEYHKGQIQQIEVETKDHITRSLRRG